MSIVSKQQKTEGPEAVASHPDFQLPWCKKLLEDRNLRWTVQVPRPYLGHTVTNTMFEKTLNGPDGIRAHLSFTRPSRQSDAIHGKEECWLMSIGHEIDGRRGRSHGGFNAVVLDQISGSVSHYSDPGPEPPATATLTIDYKAPVSTPCVIFVRGWIISIEGRKVWVRAVIENGEGLVLCASKALFVFPKPQKL